MTPNEREILVVLEETYFDWMTPTQIASDCCNAGGSSWACRHLRKLRERGLVSRVPPGGYAITNEGTDALEKQ